MPNRKRTRLISDFCLGILLAPICVINSGVCQATQPLQQSERPSPPAREPKTPGYVAARELPDGSVPPANLDGNFIIGPTHPSAPELAVQSGAPKGAVIEFTMNSSDSRI